MSRYLFLPVLLLSLLAGCSTSIIGPHRIDVQQGNALDQENLARLKPGLTRSQVRFLLGTPLVVDPFHTNRWDYVYTFHKAGKLTEQKRVTLFFEGDTLVRIEGDLPAVEPAAAQTGVAAPAETSQTVAATTAAAPLPQAAEPPAAQASPAAQPRAAQPQPTLRPETDVTQIKPHVVPVFPDSGQAAPNSNEAAVLKALNAWAEAWGQRDEEGFFAAYADSYVPQGGNRADWEKRRRLLMGLAKSIDVKIESPKVEIASDGSAVVAFNQYYRSDTYQDAVVKQLRMVERNGRWLIVEERVLSILRGKKS